VSFGRKETVVGLVVLITKGKKKKQQQKWYCNINNDKKSMWLRSVIKLKDFSLSISGRFVWRSTFKLIAHC
jgi:hypothetical protein